MQNNSDPIRHSGLQTLNYPGEQMISHILRFLKVLLLPQFNYKLILKITLRIRLIPVKC